MKIAFDLHGVIEKHPTEFKAVIQMLRAINVEVTLMSGPPVSQILQELMPLNFNTWTTPWNEYFNTVYSIVDFLRTQTYATMRMDARGHWWTDDESWWSSKARMCKQYGVDILIDDKAEYMKYFGPDHPTKFILLREMNFEILQQKVVCAFVQSMK